MRMLVLGAGRQGSACAYDLLVHSEHEVVLADLSFDGVAPFLRPYIGTRLELLPLDANDHLAVRSAMRDVAATMSAFPYYYNLEMALAAIESGSHFCDLGGNTRIVEEQKKLMDRAGAARVSVVPNCGLAPGLANIIAEYGISHFDRAREVHLKVGGLPVHPEPPLGYQIVYSLEGVLDYYTTPAWILRGGVPTRVEALSEIERLDFEGVGELEAFHTAGGLSLMAQRYEGRIDRMEYKTMRYPGHAEIMRAIRELGLLSTEQIQFHGVRVVPRDLFIAVAEPRLRKDPGKSPDLVALRVEVRGERSGEEVALRWDLLDRFDTATGISAMMRTTGFSLSITGMLQASGIIRTGVWTADEIVPAVRYIRELAQRGIDLEPSSL